MTDLAVEIYVGTPVKAVKLTAENAEEVANWIGGNWTTREMTIRSDEGRKTVKSTRVYLDRNRRRVSGAWHYGSVGDWFIMDHEGEIRIFPEEKFNHFFVKGSEYRAAYGDPRDVLDMD